MSKYKIERIQPKPIFKFTCACGKVIQSRNNNDALFVKVSDHTTFCKKAPQGCDWIEEIVKVWG